MAVRTNIVQNPKLESNGNYWSADADFTKNYGTGGALSGGYVAQESVGGFANFTTVNDSNGYEVLENTDYIFTFYYRISALSGNAPIASIRGSSAFGTQLGVVFLSNTSDVWVREDISFNSGAHTLVYFKLSNNGGNVSGEYSNFMLELGSTIDNWFDGDSVQESHTYAWVGSADASASTETEIFVNNTFTIDGIVFATNTTTFTIDAVVVIPTVSFTIDGIIVLHHTTFTIDGIVKATSGLAYKSISVMGWSKDTLRNPISETKITALINALDREFYLTHVDVLVPMNTIAETYSEGVTAFSLEPADYAQMFTDAIHNAGLGVIHRHTDCYFEGIYDFPKWDGADRLPAGTPGEVISGHNRNNWLGRVWNWIVEHPDLFADGDLWAPFPEGTGHGIFSDSTSFLPHSGSGIQTNYANFYIDLCTVSKAAFTYIDKNVRVGFSSQNWSELDSGWLPTSVHNAQGLGRAVFDHYGTGGADYSPSEMETDYNSTFTTLSLKMFHQEWGDYWSTDAGYGYSRTQAEHEAYLVSMYAVFQAAVLADKLMGFNYWRSVGGAEEIMDNVGDEENENDWVPNYAGDKLADFFAGNISDVDDTYEGDYVGATTTRTKPFLIDGEVINATGMTIFSIDGIVLFETIKPFTISALVASLTASPRTNLVPNPKFESNSNRWGLDDDFVLSAGSGGALTGGYIQQTSTGSFENFTTANDGVGITVEVGKTYTWSFYYRVTSRTGNAPYAQVNADNAFGTTLDTTTLSDTSGDWVRASMTFDSSTYTQVFLRISNNDGTVSAQYSNFLLEESIDEDLYFDGDTVRTGYTYEWLGSEDASSSMEIPDGLGTSFTIDGIVLGMPTTFTIDGLVLGASLYNLDHLIIPRPKQFKRDFIETSQSYLTLDGKTRKDYSSRKEAYTLSWDTLSIGEVTRFMELADMGIPVTFEVFDGNLVIPSTEVFVVFPSIGYSIPGENYLAYVEITLLEEQSA